MWSFGVLLHEFAVAYKPHFYGNNGDFTVNGSHWVGKDPKLFDLIKLCLS
jgi:hypothetical protein